MIKIVFLGTGDAVTSEQRNHSSIFLNYKDENMLIDCGEGTQRQIRIAKLNPCSITRILITHWHGDHILGIPGLLQTLALSGYNKTLHIYGPVGTKKYIQEIFNVFVFTGKLDIQVHEVMGKFLETNDFYVSAEKMSHGCPSNAYNFVLKESLRIDKKKLKKLKIAEGPWLADLKKGKDIIYDKKKFKVKDLTYLQEGKKISFVFDTGINDRIQGFVKDSDLLIMESSFSEEDKEKAKDYHHMTAKQDAEIAKKAKAKELVLTHLSQRYSKNFGKIEKEAKKLFKNTKLARDFMKIEI
jgi:ribonuclease Z